MVCVTGFLIFLPKLFLSWESAFPQLLPSMSMSSIPNAILCSLLP
ncbi:hypothetical protein K5549_016987, partial [Capra hircus]